MTSRTLKNREILYHSKDPGDSLFIIAEGSIEMVDPEGELPPVTMHKNDAVGWLAFLTGSYFRYRCRALEKTTVWIMPRSILISAAIEVKTGTNHGVLSD